jgi:hypothetical protein
MVTWPDSVSICRERLVPLRGQQESEQQAGSLTLREYK